MEKVFLKDYTKPQFNILQTELFFHILESKTELKSKIQFKKTQSTADLVLDGDKSIELKEIKLNEKVLTQDQYLREESSLTIFNVPETFTLETQVELNPAVNTSLEGLYKSNDLLVTQCEAQGFRKVTFYLDRPDVMAPFTVTIRGPQKKYPFLLSNGNLISQEILPDGEQEVVWQDPHKKPCYLFALVAGDLKLIKDEFITMSGKKVSLEIFTEAGFETRVAHAMESLKKSMKWDEEKFGREYDLEKYMLVSINDFNAGAMENKGLNVFNSRLVFASPDSATDNEYHAIESVVAHEYFHNWTGNRITLRDWFHLSLKEGLTVYRDQEFSADMTDPAVQRILDVTSLRERQFSEDASPNAHPVRPDSCYSVDNFFTATIYEKGAEVIRMIETLCGKAGFRKGMDLYFSRHDGEAVTTEDFVKCFEETSHLDLTQFRKWYSEAKTPLLKITDEYNESTKVYTLHTEVATDHTMMIPLRMGLVSDKGEDLFGNKTLQITTQKQSFTFDGVTAKPTPSFNRNFGSPINVSFPYTEAQLIRLAESDSDGFNRFESMVQLCLRMFNEGLQKGSITLSSAFVELCKNNLLNPKISDSLKSFLISLPSDQLVNQGQNEINPELLFKIRKSIKKQLALALQETLQSIEPKTKSKDLDFSFEAVGKRRLRHRVLGLLVHANTQYLETVFSDFNNSKNMTTRLSALSILNENETPYRALALNSFYDQWKEDPIVLNKWFGVQSQATHSEALNEIKKLTTHEKFNIKNPNNVYSLIRAFADNTLEFNKPGAYQFMMDTILKIDAMNPQVAARLATSFGHWKKLTPDLKSAAKAELERALKSNLSSNTFEIFSKSLN